MKIENKIIPEGINTTDENPLKEFAFLTFGIIGAFIVFVVIVALIAELLSPFVPFHWEKQIAARYQLLSEDSDNNGSQTKQQLTHYLQQLADRIVKAQSLPAEMNVTVHYVDEDTVNAFATLGGHIVVFRGLLEKLPNENALAWVMAHEISHIKNRDPIKSLGRGAIIGIVMSISGIAIGDEMVETVIGQSGLLTVLKFSREQEEAADIEALFSIQKLYGHVGSASTFFQQTQQIQADKNIVTFEFLETHPLTENRINKMEETIRNQGWSKNGAIKPLPKEFVLWIAKE